MSDDRILIGVVAAPHGVRGELRVKIETDFPDERFEPGTTLRLALPGGQTSAFTIDEARPHKGMVLLTLEGVGTREAAEALRGAQIFISRAEVKPLPPHTWYVFELEGLNVFHKNGAPLGTLTEVLHPGGNDVYVVKKDGRERLIPALKHVIVELDLAQRRMVVDPLEEYDDDDEARQTAETGAQQPSTGGEAALPPLPSPDAD